jgi:hypothetical protein
MREIEFRGQRFYTPNGEEKWIYGDLLYPGEQPRIIYGGYPRWEIHVIPDTVGQYTGLKDVEGRKIFEGDVVKDRRGNIGVVFFSEHFMRYQIRFYTGREDLLEYGDLGVYLFDWIYPKMLLVVIGNIHDTPELLAVGGE